MLISLSVVEDLKRRHGGEHHLPQRRWIFNANCCCCAPQAAAAVSLIRFNRRLLPPQDVEGQGVPAEGQSAQLAQVRHTVERIAHARTHHRWRVDFVCVGNKIAPRYRRGERNQVRFHVEHLEV
jgi:hypothetical protein